MKRLVLLAAILLTACAASANSRIASPGVRVADPLPQAASEWVELTPAPVEIDGRVITATCSHAPGTDPAFRYWAKRGTENALVIYFDGGGACWDDITCAVPLLATARDANDGFYKAELLPGDNPNSMRGIFDLANPANPVRNWSFVFVPYCTGDVHSGANAAHYRDPDTGEPYIIAHKGSDNFRVVLEWIRANFDAPETVLVTGSSAGAYGAATHYGRIREAFPQGHAVMLGDAGQGVTTPDFLTRRNGNWRYDLPASVFGHNAQLTHDDDIVATLAAHFPNDRFGQYTTALDRTQAAFFALMGAENACQAWTQKMSRDLTRRQGAGNFRSYLARGEGHSILRSSRFYTEASGGVPFVQWFAELLNGSPPDNSACADCLTRRTRCPF